MRNAARNAASHVGVPLLLGAALCLSACASRPPVQAAAPPARPVAQPASKPPKVVKAKRVNPSCGGTQVDLSAERKEELFRRFEAELGSGATTVPETVAEPEPVPVPRCNQASN